MALLYMETTTKDPEESLTELQLLLRGKTEQERKARPFVLDKFMANYNDDGLIEGVIFQIKMKDTGQIIPMKLPLNWRPILKFAKENKECKIKTEEQARRVAMRWIFRWMESQVTMIMMGVIDVVEALLPYIYDAKTEKTMFQAFQSGQLQLPKL